MSAGLPAGILFSRHPAGCVGWKPTHVNAAKMAALVKPTHVNAAKMEALVKPTLLNAAKMAALVDSACNFVPRVMVV